MVAVVAFYQDMWQHQSHIVHGKIVEHEALTIMP
jgi:hypothetical protein